MALIVLAQSDQTQTQGRSATLYEKITTNKYKTLVGRLTLSVFIICLFTSHGMNNISPEEN